MSDFIILLMFIIHIIFTNKYYLIDCSSSKNTINATLVIVYLYVAFVIQYGGVYIFTLSIIILIDLMFFIGNKKEMAHFVNNRVSYFQATMILISVPLIQPTVEYFT